jgi:hypothetical protein
MAYVKIEPSGCCINKGNIQVRLSMYLEPTDPRYSEHHVFVVDTTSKEYLAGYQGKLDAEGSPVDQADYDKWVDGLPHVWRDNPFNNHFIYVDGSVSTTEILEQAQDYLQEFFDGWSKGDSPEKIWQSKIRPVVTEKTLTPTQLSTANTKLNQIKVMVI